MMLCPPNRLNSTWAVGHLHIFKPSLINVNTLILQSTIGNHFLKSLSASHRELVERHFAGGQLLVHDADLPPHLRHLRLDRGAQVAKRPRLFLYNRRLNAVETANIKKIMRTMKVLATD